MRDAHARHGEPGSTHHSDRRPGRGLAAFLAASVALGVMVAGLALPAVGGVALVADTGVTAWNELPDDLPIEAPAQRSVITTSDGSQIAAIFEQNRVNVTLAQVPQDARDAVLAIEDARFYEHNGIDLRGILRAVATNREEGEIAQGGSTITQQYIKNVLVNQADTEEEVQQATERSVPRKLREMRYAMALEKKLTKDEILERYLNITYFGKGAYGIGAAAATYFGKPVEQLNLAESAFLAGLLHAPSAYENTLTEGARVRRDLVLDRMAYYGYATAEEVAAAEATPVELRLSSTPNGCQTAGDYGFFCDYVRRWLENDPTFGATPEERQNKLYRGGLTITTTIDPRMQAIAQETVDRNVPRDSDFASAIVMVEPGTGAVKAMAVNRTFGKDASRTDMTEIPLATTPAFPAGSTFKVFTLVTALDRGIQPTYTLKAPNRYTSKVFRGENGKRWVVGNAGDGQGGTYDLRRATWNSVNTYYVQIEEKVGVPNIARMAYDMGLRSLPVDEIGRNEGSFTLGARETNALEMATAYATLAAGGIYCAPLPVISVTSAAGPVATTPQTCERVVRESVAQTATSILRGVISNGTAKNASIGRAAAGKTGTVEDNRAAWFVGYTPQLSTAVMIADPTVPKRNLQNVRIGGRYYSQVFGGTLPAPMWRTTMSRALSGYAPKGFNGQEDGSEIGNKIPDVRGQSFVEAFAVLRENGFDPVLADDPVASTYPLGTIGAMSPGPGEVAGFGQKVTLQLSSGDTGALFGQ